MDTQKTQTQDNNLFINVQHFGFELTTLSAVERGVAAAQTTWPHGAVITSYNHTNLLTIPLYYFSIDFVVVLMYVPLSSQR